MEQANFTFTIFTPAYKCEKTIYRVWESLKVQTYRDFEWIIVDDASPDNLQDVITLLKKEDSDFPITSFRHDVNRGKHVAWNLALKHARGKFFIPADADDSFIPKTLETFVNLWKNISDSERKKYSGINVLCKDPFTNKLVGNEFPNAPLITNNLELKYKYKIKGEKWGMVRTDVLKKFPYPELESNRGSYVLSYAWFSIANAGYKVMCHNVALRNYYTDSSESIIQKSKINPKNSSKTLYHYLLWHINTNFIFMLKSGNVKLFLKDILNVYRNGWLEDNSTYTTLKSIDNIWLKLIMLPLIPACFILYYVTYRKYK